MASRTGKHKELYSVSLGQMSRDKKESSRITLTESEFKSRQASAMRTAKELCYPETVITRIKLATTEIQIDNILADARRRYL